MNWNLAKKKWFQYDFQVSVDGLLPDFEIMQSAGKAFDNEVIRVLKKMPKWKPAIQNGQAVARAFYTTSYICGYGTVICFNLLASNKIMLEEFEEQQRKRTTRIRSFMDFTMGGLLVVAGTLLLILQGRKSG